MARWLTGGSHRLAEWETDLSSQTGASQAGILLGSNEDIPAFRWVEKESAVMMTCSAPADCAEIERRHASGQGLLIDGGASRGNLLSGEADHVILTVSRMEAEKEANPGYRAFLANGFNVSAVRWSCTSGRSCSSGPPRCAVVGGMFVRAGIGAACTRSCARRCASSCGTWSSTGCSPT